MLISDQAIAKRWSSLRRFVEPPPAVERCGLCSATLPDEHEHLVEPKSRRMLCACQACAILFDHQGDVKYRRVPRDGRLLPDFKLADIQWNALSIPIGLAFFLHSSAAGKMVAIYPSPAGATESQLDLDTWGEIVALNPELETMQSDIEALLVNRVGSRREHLIAPIDQCYKLVGLIRTHWRGFTGGEAVWEEIDRFFTTLKARSRH